MTTDDVAVTLGWMRAGQTVLAATVDALSDDGLRAPSGLPGWTRAHVVGHVARNAEALGRLAAWARTGVETPMYADAEQRARDIETSAQAPAGVLRAELVSTAAELDAALAGLVDWRAPIRTAQGRTVPAAQIPWMRVREVWLHAVDIGAPVDALPTALAAVLLDDVTALLSSREGCPSLLLRAGDRQWHVGPAGPAATVHGPAPALAGWLTGRTDGTALTTDGGGPVPAAPRWI